jgi:hypothetical protein
VHATCSFHLGVLDRERAGTWILSLEKNSEPSARIAATAQFRTP